MHHIDYSLIPPLIRQALDNHGLHHRETGSFVTKVLENDLMEAVGRADKSSFAALPSILSYVYNEMPSNSHGSPEKVAAWRADCPRPPADGGVLEGTNRTTSGAIGQP
jgi:hypothetical protein